MMRDLKSDLSLCLQAPSGLWSRVKAIGARYWTIGVIEDHIARPFEGDQAEAAWNLIEAAREGWPEAIRRAMAAEQGMEEAEARLVADELETLDFLWQEYVQADPATLTEDAKELAARVREKVRELAGVERLEERVEDLKSAIARAIERLQDHDHEDIYGPYGLAGTQCIVHDGALCDTLDDLQAVLDKAGEG